MISREIVRRCIEFESPPRIGFHFRTEPVGGLVLDETDFAGVSFERDPRFSPRPGEKEWETEWGVRRKTINTAVGEAVGFPLGEGWHLLENYSFPDFTASWRWRDLAENVNKAKSRGKYVYGPIPSLMSLPMDLRGIENWLADNILEQENLGRLIRRIENLRELIIGRYAEAGVDAAITYDDMGTNSAPLVSPETFHSLYFPSYKRTIDLLHENEMHFIHHCCGAVREYMDMFIEAGCDVLQLDQVNLMGIDWLGKNYGGKICFWNPVDIQTTLPAGTPGQIEDEARRQILLLGNHGGGFMVKAYQQPESIGITRDRVEIQYRAFKQHAHYPLLPYEK